MSFPGYIRSLNLVSKVNDQPGSFKNDDNNIKIRDDVSKDAPSRSNSIEENINHSISQLVTEEEVVVDERGNGPSKSLWVGNIPSRTTSSELRTIFSKFGSIVSTKPQAKYAFVNFDQLDSAILAWKKCHDRDIFTTGYSTVNIRFTSSLAESKQAKDEPERKFSTATKAETAQKQWFQPIESPDSHHINNVVEKTQWPNGKPPTGPRSQRRLVSPPPLRRGDSYRPAEPPRSDSYRSDCDLRRSEADEYTRGRIYSRKSDRHYSPSHSPIASRSRGISSSSVASPRSEGICNDDSPLPWERKRTQSRFRDTKWIQVPKIPSQNGVITIDHKPSSVRSTSSHYIDNNTESRVTEQNHYIESPPSIRLRTPDDDQEDYDPESFGPYKRTSIELAEDPSLLGPMIQPRQLSKSPSLRPVERLRSENRNVRGSSAPSEVATSSTKTSTKKRRCNDCKKAGSDLSPLISCSTCVRHFHSGCGDPKPSSCANKSQFVCGRCEQKRATESATVAASPATETKVASRFTGKVQLVSPPLSLSHDGNGSVNLSPRDGMLHLLSDEYRLESFFPTRVEDAAPSTENTASYVGSRMHSMTKPEQRGIPNHVVPRPNMFLVATQDDQAEQPREKSQKYKCVTCKWWAVGNCTQEEEGCYYAHRHTAITFPDRKRVNKHWTCYDWLQHKCTLSERDCLYAHQDTGLHVWRDGRPSFKHVTCFWWIRRRCKWDAESCKFAHENTGIYSQDPAEVWLGGSKFTTARPSETRTWTDLQYRSTAQFPPSAEQCLIDMMHHHNECDKSSSAQIANRNILDAAGKPLLTINTSRKSSVVDHRAEQDVRHFASSIGALPQTPNEESPSKARFQDSNLTSRAFGHPQKMPGLPTPATEDDTRLEHVAHDNNIELHDNPALRTGIRGGAELHTTKSSDKPTSSQLRDFDQPCSSADHVPIKTPSYVNTQSRSIHSESSRLSRDPRMLRQEHDCDLPNPPAPDHSFPASVMDESALEKQPITTVANHQVATNDDNTRRGVKKCQMCYKPVFGTDTCRICSGQRRKSSLEIPSNELNQIDIVSSAAEFFQTRNSSISEDTTRGDDTPVRPKPQQAPKNPLKRNSSSSNIFLKNKRPRSSMTFSSSGSIRPDASNIQSTDRRPRMTTSTTENRKEPQTLEDLILQERRKNSRRDSFDKLDSATVHSPVAEGKDESTIPKKIDHDGNNLTRRSTQSQTGLEANSEKSSPISGTSPPADLFSSPHLSPRNNHLFSAQSPIDEEEFAGERPDNQVGVVTGKLPASAGTGTQRPDTPSQRDADKPQSPKLVPKVLPRGLPTHETPGQDVDNQKSPTTPRRNTVIHEPPVGIVSSRTKFTWPSSITCTRCRKQHKKCLHDEHGQLSAMKCREYVLARKGKPDTGRSRVEWSTILAASELEPESDDEEGSGDEHSASEDDLAFSGTEDDFEAAMDGEEVLPENVELQNAELIENPPKPPLRVNVPPKNLSVSVTDFFSQRQNQVWSAEDEALKKNELSKRGVMFESDSDDADYLSDDLDQSCQRVRPTDPLRVASKVSRDLFEVAPELDPGKLVLNTRMPNKIQSRPPRKQQWTELLSQQLQQRRERFGNPHWDVDRQHSDKVVHAFVERIVPPKNTDDRLAVGSVQIREERISFADFLGAPKLPEVCLMSDGERLAFQDGRKGRDRSFCRTGRGLDKPMTDEEKWPIRPK